MEDQSCGSAAAPCAASSASQPVAIETKSEDASVAADPRLSDLSRLFIVCGRGRKVDELRALFSTCGAIKHLHLALDRSKKSRGFAFLQYEDPANAAVAIDKLDHLELDDGHILKVTVAKERPVGGKGKLKRDQHARQDQDDKSDGGLGDEDDGVIDARLPGKRQRSSPPVTALPLGPSRVSPAFLLEAPRLEGFGADSVKIKTEMQSGNGLPAVDACKDELMEPDGDEKQVQHVLDAMVAVVEQQQSQSKLSSDLIAAYQHVVSTSDQGGKQNREASRDVETIPPRPKHHLRRRRQSLDGSGSSTEDGSDSRGIRHNTIEESYRLAKQQATRERRDHGGSMVDRGPVRPTITDVDNSYGKDRDIKLEFRTEPPEPVRTKVFFTSTYKFTEQELEAMFAVYGDFESVELVKSFGRVKTMAYVRYSKVGLSGGSTSAPSTGTVMPSSGKDRLWVLLLYDRFLATHMLSSVVSSLSGMEFMDIKVVKSTGEAQGVAFVKFDSEANATQGALQLHQMELPLGSGKFLQAIVILAPSLFTTTHGGNSISNNESMRLDRSADERMM
uniref:RRM domain-containing protein n=1 Tax=Phytophthora ramorum TaxID=164328 RepID=H3HDQ7_PHYRM